MNEIVVEPVDPTNESTAGYPWSGYAYRLAAHGRARTHLEIVHKISDREAARDNSYRKQCVLERTHVRAAAMLVFYLYVIGVFVAICLARQNMAGMKNFVQTVPAWVHLKGVREHDENSNRELPRGDE